MRFRRLLVAALAATSAAASGVALCAPAAAAGSTLTGTLYITGGSCSHGSVAGTYIQMILPSGSASGPYMSNSDSTCSNQAYTLLQPGAEGGLRFGTYQPQPSPPFDAAGDALARAITAPAQYEGTAFATSTNPLDPQTHAKVPAPSLVVRGDRVSADLSSFSVSWNKQYFNQGSPKPDGSDPGLTSPATGTYDSSTGAITLSWTSQVVGGPFDKFTGSWHLVGRFVPNESGASATTGGRSGDAAKHQAPGQASGATATTPNPLAISRQPGSAVSHPGAAGSALASAAAAPPELAATSTVSKQTWRVSWWLVALAVALAVAGFGGLALLRRADVPTAEPTA